MVPIRAKLEKSPVTFGTWLAIGSSHSAEVMGQVGYDWVIVDAQHGGMSEAHLLPMLQALDLTGTPALVRVNWLDPALIMRVCDLGAAGVVVPLVNTANDARHAVEAMRYPPQGMRSFGPVRGGYAGVAAPEDPLCLCMIETVEALGNLDAIAATPGLDGLLVGPVDLALSMGHGLSLQMPDEVLAAIEKVAAACRANDIICASFAMGPDNAAELVKRGVSFIGSGSDAMAMRRASGEDLAALRAIGGGSAHGGR